MGEPNPARSWHVTVFDDPTPKGRPRSVVVNGRVRAYTPSKTRLAEHHVRTAVSQLLPSGHEPLSGPVRLVLTAFMRMPASVPKRDRETAMPARRPDLANIIMLVADGLAPLVDDSRIVDVIASKRYGAPPRLEIDVEERTSP